MMKSKVTLSIPDTTMSAKAETIDPYVTVPSAEASSFPCRGLFARGWTLVTTAHTVMVRKGQANQNSNELLKPPQKGSTREK